HRPDADRTAQTELSGAVDGLARRVEDGLALVCVKQRRAAAAAADAISATSSAAAAAAALESQRRKKDMHSRKRKSIPDMSRHSKHSRIPADNADSAGADRKHSHRRPASPSDAASNASASASSSGDDGDAEIAAEIAVGSVGGLDPQTRAVLAHFQSRALTLKSIHADLRALRYQRKQQLRRSIANALDAWGRQRRRQRQRHRLPGGTAGARAMVEVPLADGGAPIRACVQCATTGRQLVRCGGCGDPFHWFCADGVGGSSDGSRFVCAACRVCARCLDDAPHGAAALAQCRECRRYMHPRCGGAQQQQPAAAGAAGWICDDCVECLECGLRATAQAGSTEWTHDHSMCGGCARQIERARVCPECVATYSSRSVGASMVCCDVCSFWIHTECDARLTPAVYDALITLEDAPYVCPACARSNGALLLPDIDASSASELDDDALDEAAVAAIPALPRCLRAAIGQQQQHVAMGAGADSETETDSEADAEAETQTTDAAIATLLASQATLASPVAPDADTAAAAEAANLLLSLTRSDVRFDRSRFDIEALESRYCAALPASLTGPPVRDWRRCALCGLCGDGAAAPHRPAQRPSLGRLVPLLGAAAAASRWAHVECVAWAWGPVATSAAAEAVELPPPSVRFQGALLLDSKDRIAGALPCTLCGRPGASFHCCAPVACFDTAYHLPCLLLAGTPSPTLAHPQFCAAWRRALCASHAPEFAAMMPADHDVRGTLYDCVRVTAAIDNMPPPHKTAQSPPAPVSVVSDSHCAARIGNLFVLAWAPAPADPLGAGFHCLRFIDLPGAAPRTLALRCAAPNVWAGGTVAGFPAACHALSLSLAVSAPSLSALLRALLARIVPAPTSLLLAATIDLAVRYPLRFLGLCNLPSASSLSPPVSASPLPRPAADPGKNIAATHHPC
ncbi:Histone-lysine N-methyltransferase, partial [Coemansia sp. RSA 1285]